MSDERRVYAVFETVKDENGNYIPCIVREGMPGYYRTDFHWGPSLEQAEELVNEANRRLGIEPDEATRIVFGSIAISMADRRKGENEIKEWLIEMINQLDGEGLVITDEDLIRESLKGCSFSDLIAIVKGE